MIIALIRGSIDAAQSHPPLNKANQVATDPKTP